MSVCSRFYMTMGLSGLHGLFFRCWGKTGVKRGFFNTEIIFLDSNNTERINEVLLRCEVFHKKLFFHSVKMNFLLIIFYSKLYRILISDVLCVQYVVQDDMKELHICWISCQQELRMGRPGIAGDPSNLLVQTQK